jgi:hypothetical protein
MLVIEGLNENIATKCVQFFCSQLGIDVPKFLHIFVDETIKVNGAVYQNAADDYLMVLKGQEDGQMIVTLAHELTHVKQFIKNNLADEFTNDIPYMERWWEIEAYKMEEVLIKALIEKLQTGEISL